MNINLDPTKQAHEVLFCRKAKEIYHASLVFSNTSVSQSSSLKHLCVILDSKSIFNEHVKMVSIKISKTLGLLRKLYNLLPRPALITTYNSVLFLNLAKSGHFRLLYLKLIFHNIGRNISYTLYSYR